MHSFVLYIPKKSSCSYTNAIIWKLNYKYLSHTWGNIFFFILDNLRAQCGYIGFVWQSLVVGGDRGGCCEKLLEASKGANCGVTEQGSQLWGNRAKKGDNCATTCNCREERENVRNSCADTRSVRGRRCSRADAPAASLFLIILL